MLTKVTVRTFLQNATAALIDDSYNAILDKRKGKECDCLKNLWAQNLIYSMQGFIPESEVISGTQATIDFTIPAFGGTKTFTLVVTSIDFYATYTLSISGGSVGAAAIVTFINSFYPAPYSYTATSVGAVVTVAGSNYDEDNGTTFHVTISGDTLDQIKTMAGGVAAVYQNNDCITDEEAGSILEKINSLISPCAPFEASIITVQG
jgi:hypothetical protein